MHAIYFDLAIHKLRETFLEDDDKAYDEISIIMKKNWLRCIRFNLFITKSNDNSLEKIYSTLDELKKFEWFKVSLTKLNVFRVEDWSDFTEIVKQ